MTTVLVVDDDADLREMVGLKLQRSGFDVLDASNGEEALQAVAAQAPDVVLLDIMMPGMSGLDVLSRWRADTITAHLPVLLLTARAQDAEIARGYALGADDYVVKPFSHRDLVQRLNHALERAAT